MMKTLKKKQKKWIWRLVLTCGLVAELAFIGIAVSSLLDGNSQIPLWQATLFVAIAVWIYIAYLKQRAADISHFVVDEKIKTHSLVQHLKEGIIVVDPDNRILLLNAKACEVTGLPDVESLGQDLSSKVDATIGSILDSGQAGETEGEITQTGRTVRMSVIPLPGSAHEAGHKLVYVHPRQEPASPVAQGESDAGGHEGTRYAELLGLMSAELGKTLGDTSDPADRNRIARLILRSLGARLDMPGDSGVTSIEDGTLAGSLRRTSVSVKTMLDEVEAEIAPLLAAAGIRVELGGGNGLVMSCDHQWLGLAIRQVIYNAVLASHPDGNPLAIRTGAMGSNTGIAVTDRGPAISPDSLESLFDYPYAGVAAPDGGIVRPEGSGLFLARGVVEAHGGTLVAESPAEGGLRVMIMIPGES